MYIEYTNSCIFLTAIYQYLFNIWARPAGHRCTLLCLEPFYDCLVSCPHMWIWSRN